LSTKAGRIAGHARLLQAAINRFCSWGQRRFLAIRGNGACVLIAASWRSICFGVMATSKALHDVVRQAGRAPGAGPAQHHRC